MVVLVIGGSVRWSGPSPNSTTVLHPDGHLALHRNRGANFHHLRGRYLAGAGISVSDIRDMTLAAVERRFGTDHAPHRVEHLSDNGSCYTARETRNFATALGLVPCFTPVRSPESNGMSESFVKPLKRDYVRVTPLPDAQTVLGLVAGWITDYNV